MLVVVGIPGVEDVRLGVESGLVVGAEAAAIGSPLQSTGQTHDTIVKEVVGGRIYPPVQSLRLAEVGRGLGLDSQVFAVVAAWDVLGRLSGFPLDFRRGYSVLMERMVVKVEATGRTHLLHRTHCHRRVYPSNLAHIVVVVVVAAVAVALVLWGLEEDHEAAELSKAQADVVCYQDCNLSAAVALS
jgi:hypothetical protein